MELAGQHSLKFKSDHTHGRIGTKIECVLCSDGHHFCTYVTMRQRLLAHPLLHFCLSLPVFSQAAGPY